MIPEFLWKKRSRWNHHKIYWLGTRSAMFPWRTVLCRSNYHKSWFLICRNHLQLLMDSIFLFVLFPLPRYFFVTKRSITHWFLLLLRFNTKLTGPIAQAGTLARSWGWNLPINNVTQKKTSNREYRSRTLRQKTQKQVNSPWTFRPDSICSGEKTSW